MHRTHGVISVIDTNNFGFLQTTQTGLRTSGESDVFPLVDGVIFQIIGIQI